MYCNSRAPNFSTRCSSEMGKLSGRQTKRVQGTAATYRGCSEVDYGIPEWVRSQHPQKRLPEAWIGQQVVIQRPSGKELWVVLRDVREFGVLYTMIGIPQPIFSPWSSIVWMRPAGEDTQAFEMPEQEGS
jgi:hypothetical protein